MKQVPKDSDDPYENTLWKVALQKLTQVSQKQVRAFPLAQQYKDRIQSQVIQQ